MRLQFGIIATLIAIAIVVLLLTGDGAREDASVTGAPSQEPDTTATTSAPPQEATPLPEPTVTPRLQPPEWGDADFSTFAGGSLPFFVANIATGETWGLTPAGPATSTLLTGWAPNGDALVGVQGGGRTDLYLGRPGEDLAYWLTVEAAGTPRWSPDGQLVAIDDLILDAGNTQEVTRLPQGVAIGWSADSRYYATTIGSREEPRIVIWNREAGELRELLRANAGVWSTNGSLLAYRANPLPGTEVHPNEVLVQDIANGEIILSTTISALDAWPVAWSRSDEYLVASVFQRPEDGEFATSSQAHIISLRSGAVTVQVTGARPEKWLSTSDTLLLSGNVCSAFDIFTVAADGSALTNHTATERWELYQALSPDSNFVAFTTGGAGDRSVNTLSLATGEVSPIATGGDASLWRIDPVLVWSPDGQHLVFSIELGHGICEGSVAQETEVTILP